MKKTVVIGASTNPDRVAYRAISDLRRHGHPVIALGLKEGRVADIEIQTDRPEIKDADTVTLYVGPAHQPSWYDYIIDMAPKRIIFNPGTENPSFMELAREHGIAVEASCTLVLLAIGGY